MMVQLQTNDLILRAVTRNDLGEIARMWLYPEKTTEETARQVLKSMEENHSRNRPNGIYHLCLGIFQKTDPQTIIGWCGLDGKAEAGKTVLFYMIAEEFRRRGYATQCASALLRYAFEDMDYETVYGGCARDNVGSFLVMQKAGMNRCSCEENGDYWFYMDRTVFHQQNIQG